MILFLALLSFVLTLWFLNPRLDHAFLPPYRIVHTLPQFVVEGSVNVLPPSLIATILSSRNRHDITLPSSPSLVLLFVRTVALGCINAQGRLDARECGDAEEDNGNEHEKGEK